MNVPVTVTNREAPPDCFGNPKLWNRNHPACAGGPDANYVNPDNGKNVRYQCNYFNSCGSRVAATLSSVIPAQNLFRPPIVTPPPEAQAAPQPAPQPFSRPYSPPAPASNFGEYVRRVEAERVAAIGSQYGVPYPQHPYPTWASTYAVPPFLSAEELRHPGESWWSPLIRQLLRGLGKAIGHVAAHWFDTHVMKAAVPEKKPEERRE
jgi:hypothetical protein